MQAGELVCLMQAGVLVCLQCKGFARLVLLYLSAASGWTPSSLAVFTVQVILVHSALHWELCRVLPD
jgi:hypothetical protein